MATWWRRFRFNTAHVREGRPVSLGSQTTRFLAIMIDRLRGFQKARSGAESTPYVSPNWRRPCTGARRGLPHEADRGCWTRCPRTTPDANLRLSRKAALSEAVIAWGSASRGVLSRLLVPNNPVSWPGKPRPLCQHSAVKGSYVGVDLTSEQGAGCPAKRQLPGPGSSWVGFSPGYLNARAYDPRLPYGDKPVPRASGGEGVRRPHDLPGAQLFLMRGVLDISRYALAAPAGDDPGTP